MTSAFSMSPNPPPEESSNGEGSEQRGKPVGFFVSLSPGIAERPARARQRELTFKSN